MEGTEVLFRDACDIQPPASAYERKLKENIYSTLEPAQFVACPEDIWQPLSKGEDAQGEAVVKVCTAAHAAPLHARITRDCQPS